MQQQLLSWKKDDSVKAVILQAAPGNAFCAGGDVRWLYNSGKVGDPEQIKFFWHEYRLNHFIHHLGKPYISLMDGMTMGGGVGVSMHGSHPVASERFIFAMPETSIGFFPDIGASHLLSGCPGNLGIYLGLTGNRLGPEDSMKAGLVKQVVSSEQMPLLVQALLKLDLSSDAYDRVDGCLNEFARSTPVDFNTLIKPEIDVCFSPSTVEQIRDSLQSTSGSWAMGVDNSLAAKCPLSLKVTLAQLHKARGLDLAACLKMDYDLVGHFMRGSDFYEGVRALLIDKDKNPAWNPSRLDLVSESMVVNYFERANEGLEFSDL